MKDDQLDPIIAQAVKAFPQRPFPANFLQSVLAKVAQTPQVQLAPRFHLQLFDFALPTFVAGVVVLLIKLAQGSISFQPQVAWSIQFANRLLQFSPELLGILLPLLAIELVGMGLICLWLWGDRPYLLQETADFR